MYRDVVDHRASRLKRRDAACGRQLRAGPVADELLRRSHRARRGGGSGDRSRRRPGAAAARAGRDGRGRGRDSRHAPVTRSHRWRRRTCRREPVPRCGRRAIGEARGIARVSRRSACRVAAHDPRTPSRWRRDRLVGDRVRVRRHPRTLGGARRVFATTASSFAATCSSRARSAASTCPAATGTPPRLRPRACSTASRPKLSFTPGTASRQPSAASSRQPVPARAARAG